jgi:hypothetical protein
MSHRMYGRMQPNVITASGPVLVLCNKCKQKFNIEKQHTELYSFSMFFSRTKTGTLTPATEKLDSFYRLCPGCLIKLKDWFSK